MGRYLRDSDRAKIVDLYESRLLELGRNVKTVGWGNVEDQILRFEVLTRGLNLKGKRILDVGCGLGDFIPYVRSIVGDYFTYVGIDVAEGFIRSAQEIYTEEKYEFRHGDIFETIQKNEIFDIVILSGALSFRIDDNMSYAKEVIGHMVSVSKEVVSVNFLSSYVDYQAEKNFHYSPEEMFSFGKSLSPRVALIHDYPLYEFTLQIFPLYSK